MTKKPFLVCFFAMAVVCGLLASAPALALDIEASTVDFRVGEPGSFTATGSAAVDFTWTFSAGTPARIVTGDVVNWTAPGDTGSDAPMTVTATVDDGISDPVSKNITVYSNVRIKYRQYIPHIVGPGRILGSGAVGSQKVLTAEGGTGTYAWWFQGPAYGASPHYQTGGPSTDFRAPTAGVYAGKYTIYLFDSLCCKTQYDCDFDCGTQFNVWVPTEIRDNAFIFGEFGDDVTFTLTGAPNDGISYTPYIRTGPSLGSPSQINNPDYGTFTVQPGPSVDGVYTFTYTPPQHVVNNELEPFYIFATANKFEPYPYIQGANIYEPNPFGPCHIRKTQEYTGRIIDGDTGENVPLATVMVVEPTQYIRETTADNEGVFTFQLPVKSTYLFAAVKDGYLQTQWKTSDRLSYGIISRAQPNQTITGKVTLPDGSDVPNDQLITVALVKIYSESHVPKIVLAGEKKQLGGQYRLDLNEVPDFLNNTYTLLAYRPRQYTEDQLPIGTVLPLANADLQLEEKFTNIPMTSFVDAPYKGGIQVDAVFKLESKKYEDFTYIPDGQVEILASGIDIARLVSNPYATEFIGELDGNYPEEHERRHTFITFSPTLLGVTVRDKGNVENIDIVKSNSMRVTIPIDLRTVAPGAVEDGTVWIRRDDTEFGLTDCYADQVPIEDVLATDYTGNGQWGWVTFYNNGHGQWFGIGNPCAPPSDDRKDFVFPPFDRYELFGCFIGSSREEPRPLRWKKQDFPLLTGGAPQK